MPDFSLDPQLKRMGSFGTQPEISFILFTVAEEQFVRVGIPKPAAVKNLQRIAAVGVEHGGRPG